LIKETLCTNSLCDVNSTYFVYKYFQSTYRFGAHVSGAAQDVCQLLAQADDQERDEQRDPSADTVGMRLAAAVADAAGAAAGAAAAPAPLLGGAAGAVGRAIRPLASPAASPQAHGHRAVVAADPFGRRHLHRPRRKDAPLALRQGLHRRNETWTELQHAAGSNCAFTLSLA